MSEVVLPRTLLAVAILVIAGIAVGGAYYFFFRGHSALNAQAIQDISSSLGEAAGSGEGQSEPISFSGGSVSVVYETHNLSIYYNLSETLGSLPGVGEVKPIIYEASVRFPVLLIEPGGEVETYNDTGPILGVASADQGLAGLDKLVYAYSDGQKILVIPRLVILYSVDDTEDRVNLTIVVPKMNVTCSTGQCTNLNGKYAIRVTAKIVDVLPAPYEPYNPLAEGRDIEASFNASGPTIIPANMFGKAPITSVGLEYTVSIDIMYLYYDIYLERVG
ncbi:MAG: hypothetical protein F7C34_03400 [Desulfurococcales archaeon]|nr:hypothetical protein [Desulfurococcales archaeon]